MDRPPSRSRRVRPLSAQRLAAGALRYLEKFAASEASLRRVLQNKIRRACLADPSLKENKALLDQLQAVVEDIIALHKKTGVINDEAFAATKVNSLRRSGASARRIKEKLAHKGVAADTVQTALHAHDADGDYEDDGDASHAAEAKAALVFAKKRGLGGFRSVSSRKHGSKLDDDARRKQSVRDAQSMARAGFSFDVIRRVLKSDVLDESE